MRTKVKIWMYWIAFVIFASAPFHPQPVKAETKVLLSPVTTDEMYEIIQQTDAEGMDYIISDIMERDNVNRAGAIVLIRRYLLAFAEFDIDEDGTSELITIILHGSNCGTAGCSGYKHEKIDGKWISMGGGLTVYSLHAGPVAIIDDHRWHHYAPAHPKFKLLQEKYGTKFKPGWWRGERD